MQENDFEKEVREIFLTETREMLDRTEAAFIAIEDNPQDSEKVDEIFRVLHTIKGSAHMSGFKDLGEFAHLFENLLSCIRDKKLEIDSKVVDLLLAGNDLLGKFVDALSRDHDAVVDTSELSARLSEQLHKSGQAGHTDVSTPAQVELQAPQSSDTSTVENIPQTSELSTPVRKEPEGVASSSEAVQDSQKASVNESNSQQAESSLAMPTPHVEDDRSTILIVEDEVTLLELTKMMLDQEPYRVLTATNGLEALEVLKKEKVDVIVTDLRMPKMDGLELLRAIRASGLKIPAIVASGYSERSHLAEFIKLGVFDFIDKPFLADRFVLAVRNATSEKRLKDSIIKLSKINFKMFVSFRKREALRLTNAKPEEINKELEYIENFVNEVESILSEFLVSNPH